MSGFEALRVDRPWNDGTYPLLFSGSGKTAKVLFAGGSVAGDEDTIADAYSSAASLKDFIAKCRQAGLSVHASELLQLELNQ